MTDEDQSSGLESLVDNLDSRTSRLAYRVRVLEDTLRDVLIRLIALERRVDPDPGRG